MTTTTMFADECATTLASASDRDDRERVIATLREAARAWGRLRDRLLEQREAIVSHDVERLERSTRELEKVARGIPPMSALDADLTLEYGDDGSRRQQDGTRVKRRLREICEAARREAKLNQELLGDALAYTRTLLKTLTPEGDTYCRAGETPSLCNAGGTLDRKA